MKHGPHPVHFLPVDDLTVAPGAARLLDCRVDSNKPTLLNQALVLFSDPWKAARFLETVEPNHREFKARDVGAAEILALKDVSVMLVIDPCPVCGFQEEIEIDELSHADLERLLHKHLAENAARADAYETDARQAYKRGHFEEAFDLLAIVAQHLAPGDPEIHFLIAECAIKLEDSQALETAKANLQNIDPSWLEKLPK